MFLADCRFLPLNAPVYSYLGGVADTAVPPDASRQAQSQRNPPKAPSSGGFRFDGEPRPARPDRGGASLDVVTAALEIGKQRVECRPLHHMGAIVRAGAIPDRDHVTQIGRHLHAAPA